MQGKDALREFDLKQDFLLCKMEVEPGQNSKGEAL
jgi:hypothetical protein